MNPDRRPALDARMIAGWTLVGGLLRAWNFPRLGLNHFDEGIYAVAALWIQNAPSGVPFIDPDAMLYAPPAFPSLVALAYALFGAADRSALLVSWIAGTLTIPIAGVLGRRWLGPGGGAAVAALAALAGPHVAFSRMVLTDATFLLTWIAALGLGASFVSRPAAGRAILFGAAVGGAQLVKYNGWLAGIIPALACAASLLHSDAAERSKAQRGIAWGLLAALVAAVVYAPWFRFVEAHGGYAALLRHHASYVDGLDSWATNWRLQMAQGNALAGSLAGPIGWGALAWAGAWISIRAGRPFPSRGDLLRFALGALALGLVPELPWWLGLAALPTLIRSRGAPERVLAACWLVMSAMTPLYHPYARLWLPLHATGWFVVAWWAMRNEAVPAANASRSARRWARAVVGLGLLVHLLLLAPAAPWPGLLDPSDGLRRTVRGHIGDDEQGRPAYDRYVYILSRPSAVFYLIEGGLTPRRLDDAAEVAPRVLGGQQVMVDEFQVPGWSTGLPTDRLPAIGRVELPATTELDIDPAASLRPRHEPRSMLLWATPRPPPATR